MPVSVSPTATARPVAAADGAPRPGDPTCVAFAASPGGFRHAGTRSLAIEIVPPVAAPLIGGAGGGPAELPGFPVASSAA